MPEDIGATMSFLLVGDNRTNNNWGGRGGALALHELLGESLGPGGRSVYGREFSLAASGYGYHSRLFPSSKAWLARSLAAGESGHPLLRALHRLDRFCGAGDFLTDDAECSVRNLRARMAGDPGLRDLHDRVAAADLVVINGEGDVVFGRPVRRHVRFFAAMVHLARDLGKPVAFVNTMLSDCARTGRDPAAFAMTRAALAACDLVTVRDHRSLALARDEMGLAHARLIPDALFHWYDRQQRARQQLPTDGDFLIAPPEREHYFGRLDLGGDYICVGGNSRVTLPGELPRIAAAYADLCASLLELGYPVHVAISDGRDGFLEDVARDLGLGVIPLGTPIHLAAAVLGRARLFVSGRYHPTIMAALGGTPCIYLDTGAHKMQSLAGLLAEDSEPVFSAAPDTDEIAQIRELAAARLAAGATLRDHLSTLAAQRATEVASLGPLIADTAGRSAPLPPVPGHLESDRE